MRKAWENLLPEEVSETSEASATSASRDEHCSDDEMEMATSLGCEFQEGCGRMG